MCLSHCMPFWQGTEWGRLIALPALCHWGYILLFADPECWPRWYNGAIWNLEPKPRNGPGRDWLCSGQGAIQHATMRLGNPIVSGHMSQTWLLAAFQLMLKTVAQVYRQDQQRSRPSFTKSLLNSANCAYLGGATDLVAG